MTKIVTTVAVLLSLAAAAQAQAGPAFSLADDVEAALERVPVIDYDFRIGPRVGFLKERDADRGTWSAGVQARLHFSEYLAAEGSITFHQSDFEDGDISVTNYPIEVSGLVYPFPDLQIRPYGLAGAGWYYTRTTFHGALDAISSETDSFFGVHLGFGAETGMSEKLTLNADLRYVFVNERDLGPEDEEFDFWQFTAGANLKF